MASEPLHEQVETSWLIHMKRFNEEIYPILFEPFGLTKAEAHIVWEISNLRNEVEQVKAILEEDADDADML